MTLIGSLICYSGSNKTYQELSKEECYFLNKLNDIVQSKNDNYESTIREQQDETKDLLYRMAYAIVHKNIHYHIRPEQKKIVETLPPSLQAIAAYFFSDKRKNYIKSRL